MATDDVYLLSLKALQNGQPLVNSLAFRRLISAEPTSSSFSALATGIKDALKTVQVNDVTWQDWRALKVRGAGVTYQTTAPFRTSTVSFAGPFTGTLLSTITVEPEPNQVAAVCAINTAEAGRRRKGRFYVGGVYITAIDDTSLLASSYMSTFVTNVIGLLANYCVGGSDTEWRLGVWSDRTAMNVALSNTWPRTRISMGDPDPGNAFADATGLDLRQYVGNQRGRRPGI